MHQDHFQWILTKARQGLSTQHHIDLTNALTSFHSISVAQGSATSIPLATYQKRQQMDQKKYWIVCYSGLNDETILDANNGFWRQMLDENTLESQKLGTVRQIINHLATMDASVKSFANEEFQVTLAKTNFDIEEIQTGKHNKGLGAAAFFKQSDLDNRKLEQNVRRYYLADVKLTTQVLDSMRLSIGYVPVNSSLETKEWLRLVIFVLAFFFGTDCPAVVLLDHIQTSVNLLAQAGMITDNWKQEKGLGIVAGIYLGLEEFFNVRISKEQYMQGYRITPQMLPKFCRFATDLRGGNVPDHWLWPQFFKVMRLQPVSVEQIGLNQHLHQVPHQPQPQLQLTQQQQQLNLQQTNQQLQRTGTKRPGNGLTASLKKKTKETHAATIHEAVKDQVLRCVSKSNALRTEDVAKRQSVGMLVTLAPSNVTNLDELRTYLNLKSDDCIASACFGSCSHRKCLKHPRIDHSRTTYPYLNTAKLTDLLTKYEGR